MRGTRTYVFVGASLLVLAACADRQEPNVTNGTATVSPDLAQVVAAGDAQWLNLTGRVVSSQPNGFMLDYGAGDIRVEMDDWDSFQEGRLLKAGDQVTVSGLADRDLFLNKRLEAQSVFVHNLNTVFHASSADEESLMGRAAASAGAQRYSDFTGIVSAIEGREFTLGNGPAAIRIDTSLLAENPLDSEGLQQVKVGDRVLVWGDVDLERAESAEVKARGLISIIRRKVGSGSSNAAGHAAPNANAMTPVDGNAAESAGNAAASNVAGNAS